MSRLIASMITPEMVAKFQQRIKEDMDRKAAFLESDLCKRMTSDILSKAGEIDAEEVAYFCERVQERFGWSDITKEQIQEYINAMSWTVGADAFIDGPDAENPFSHSYHLKGGVMIFMMHGQGTHIAVMAPQVYPEMFEKLNDIVPRKITVEYRWSEKDEWQIAHGHGCSNIQSAKSYTAQFGGKVFRWSAE